MRNDLTMAFDSRKRFSYKPLHSSLILKRFVLYI